MWRKLLIFLISLHVKLFLMENLTKLPENVQQKSSSNLTKSVKGRLHRVTNENSRNSHFQPLKQPLDQTTEVSRSYQDQQTIQDDSAYLDETNKASIFLKELRTGLPQSDDDVVPFKATSEYLKGSSLVEEGIKNTTYSERFVYMPVGGNEIIPCVDKLELKSTVKSITHIWTDHLGKEIKKRRQSRLNVDERYRLSITNAQTDDVGIYHCSLSIIYIDNGGDMNIDNLVSLNVFVNPDLALEFPFVFESTTCDKERNGQKLNDIKGIICDMTTTSCVYQFEMTCSVEPWQHRNMPYIPRSKLLILVTKFSDPDYRPPECDRDCLMGNKFDHLLANLGIIKKAIDMTVNDSNLTFYSGLTMLNRKLVYSCDAGFSLFRESCVPCFPGTYNPKRRMNLCVPCPMNTYMEQPGARDCLQCETGKRTEAVGSDNIHKCVDKEIKIIRLRTAFFVLCGIVGGLLGILLAVFIVKIRDKMKKFVVPPGAPKETPSELAKLLAAKQHEIPKEATPGTTLPMEKQPKPEALQSVIQGAREKLRKASDTKASKTAISYPVAHQLPKDLVPQEKPKKMDNAETIPEGVHNVSVTNQPTHAAVERPANQPEGIAKLRKDFVEKQKSMQIQVSDMIRQSVLDVRSLAAEFTQPVSKKKPKKAKLARLSKQSILPDLARASQDLTQQRNAASDILPQPVRTPAEAITTSYQSLISQMNTGSAAQPNLSSSNKPTKEVPPQVAAPYDRSQAQPVRLPSVTSHAQPVGQTQPPAALPVPSSPSILNSQANPLPFTQQKQSNPPQVDIPVTQLAVNNPTQTSRTVALPQSSTYVSAAAGNLPQKSLSKNLNQNADLNNDYSRPGQLKTMKGLEMNYAEGSYSIQEQALKGKDFSQLKRPHYLYDQVFWTPITTTAPSHTDIMSTAHGEAFFPYRESPSPNQTSVFGHGHVSENRWNQNEGEQNTFMTSSYALQEPYQSQDTTSIQQSYYHRDSSPHYQNIGQQDYKDSATGPKQ